MGKSIKGEKLTPETLTKPIVQTCIESIIVIDKHNIVFVLPNVRVKDFQTRTSELIYISSNRYDWRIF